MSFKRSSELDPPHCPLSRLAGELNVVSLAVVPEWLPCHILESLNSLGFELAELSR